MDFSASMHINENKGRLKDLGGVQGEGDVISTPMHVFF